MRTLLLSAAVILGLAGAARADYWTVNTFVESGTLVSAGTETNITAGDGVATTLTLGPSLNQVWTMTIALADFTTNPSTDLDIRLGGVSGAQGGLTSLSVVLNTITWNGSGPSSTVTPNVQVATTDTANYFFNGFSSVGTVSSLVLSFTITTGTGTTGTFTMEALANPEPGTLALFGLGAAGLGAAAWRRRRARRTKAAQVA